MQTQPSAQGIASLYMGNPGALQQRIQKTQQAKPGLPPDLKQLMALNIVTNEQDAAKRQQAMNALNSMAPAGEEPPTVAESIQEQAKQKMQAKMLQQQRQQQGLQALAQKVPSDAVPENVPQPEAQPAGIDELPVDMEFAGGGIVAFAKGDTTRPEPTEEDLEKQRREDAEKIQRVKKFLADKFGAAGAALSDAAIKAVAAGADIATLIPRGLAGAVDTAVIRPARAMGANIDYLSPALTPGPQSSDTATPFYDRYIRAREAREEKPPTQAAALAPTAAPSQAATAPTPAVEPPFAGRSTGRGGPTREELLAYERSQQKAAAPRPAPPRPSAQPPALPPPVSDTYPDETMRGAATTPNNAPTGLDALYQEKLRERMSLDPEARAKAMRERYEKNVGAPDTAQYDRLIAELESRKKQFDAPKPGFEGFAEYMKQIAAAGPQRSSMRAGAMGALGLDKLNKERQAQQFDLTKQGIDIAQKKLDTERGYKKDLFTLTEAERDQIDKQVQDAIKEQGLNSREAERYKRDLEMEALRQKNSLALEGVRQKGALELEGVRARNAAASRPMDLQGELAKALLNKDEKRAAIIRRAIAEGSGAKKPGLDMELLKKFENLPGVKTDLEMLAIYRGKKDPKPADLTRIQEIEARLLSKARANGIDPSQIGLGGSSTSTTGTSTRTIDFNAIP